MSALFFGDSDRPLWGWYHAPLASGPRPPAVLICPPIGEEGIRANRLLRVLAQKLARIGAPVLRFDYYGTGDSGGDCTEVCYRGLIEDIQEAHQELSDTSLSQKVVWLGLGLGASAAVAAACKTSGAPAGMMLWEPVIKGDVYLDCLGVSHTETVAHLKADTDQGIGLGEALGFAMSEDLRSELAELDLLALKRRPARRLVVLANSATPDAVRLSSVFSQLDADVIEWSCPDDSSWNSDKALNSFVVPTETINMIIDGIKEWR